MMTLSPNIHHGLHRFARIKEENLWESEQSVVLFFQPQKSSLNPQYSPNMRPLLLFTLILIASSFCFGQDQDTTTKTAMPLKIQEEAPTKTLDTLTFNPFVERPMPSNLDSVTKAIPSLPTDIGAGSVVFRVFVDSVGGYERHEIISTNNLQLPQYFEPHLPKIRFVPGMLQGRPVAYWVLIPLKYMVLK